MPSQLSFYMSQLHSLIHDKLNNTEQKSWQPDLDKIEKYLHESLNRSNTRSIVFFSAGKNLWEVLEFEFFLSPVSIISHAPYLEPIEESLETYQKYLVLLVDRKKARLFTVHLGKIVEHKDIFDGEVPQKVIAKTINFGRGDKIMRDIEGHLHRHLQLINQVTREFVKGKHIHFIVLGSHQELLPKIKLHLKYPLKKMVLGEFVTELNIPLNEVLSQSKTIAVKINKRISQRKKLKKESD